MISLAVAPEKFTHKLSEKNKIIIITKWNGEEEKKQKAERRKWFWSEKNTNTEITKNGKQQIKHTQQYITFVWNYSN